jgi:hypothetical protein
MITRYVGVFCANDKCRHLIPLSSHQTDSPNTDLDPSSEIRNHMSEVWTDLPLWT